MTEFIEQIFSTIFGDNVILATILISIVPIIEIKGAIPFAMSTKIWGTVALSSVQALLFSLIGSCLIVPILALIYIPIINALKKSKLFKKLAIKIEEKVNKSKNRIESRVETSKDNNQENVRDSLNTTSEEQKDNIEIKSKTPKTADLNEQTSKIDVELKKEEIIKEDITKKKKYDKIFFIKLISVFLFVCVPLPLTGVWTGTCVAVVLGLGFGWTCLSVISGNIVAGILVSLVASIPGFDSIYIVYAVLVFILVVIIYSLIKNFVNKKRSK